MPAFQTSPGTRDILPPDSGRMRHMVEIFADLVERAGYGLIVPPMFEDLGVFERPDHDSAFKLLEMAPGVTADEIKAKTTAHYLA